MSPRWGSTPRLTGRLTVGRNVTLTLTKTCHTRFYPQGWSIQRPGMYATFDKFAGSHQLFAGMCTAWKIQCLECYSSVKNVCIFPQKFPTRNFAGINRQWVLNNRQPDTSIKQGNVKTRILLKERLIFSIQSFMTQRFCHTTRVRPGTFPYS
jgi:hypothetical protein